MSETGVSARAQLIKTRRGTWIDKSLLPAARRECQAILKAAAREAVGEETVLARLDLQRVQIDTIGPSQNL